MNTRQKILFGASILFGLMMVNSGLNKFFNYMPMPEMPEQAENLLMAFFQSGWLIPLIAVAEIVGGALFITNKYRALGAIIILPVIIGIILFHSVLAPEGLFIAIILLGINLWAIAENRDKYLSLIK